MAKYLGYMHEAIFYYGNYYDFFQSDVPGDVTTCYPHVKDCVKNYPKVFIHRPVEQVKWSIGKAFGMIPEGLDEMDLEMRSSDGLHVDFDDIDSRLPEICEYLGVEYDKSKAIRMRAENIQDEPMMNVVRLEVEKCLGE